MAKITIDIPVANEAERIAAEQSLQRLATKIEGKGAIKLVHKYETDTFVKMAVNKVLTSK